MNEYNYNDWRNYLMHYNHNHDALGRFTTSTGYAALTTKANKYKSKYQKQKVKADKASAKAGKTYRKLYVKKGHKLENKYAKQKVKADKLTAKANKTYKKEVEYENKAQQYLEKQFAEERKNMKALGYAYDKKTGTYKTKKENGIYNVYDPEKRENTMFVDARPKNIQSSQVSDAAKIVGNKAGVRKEVSFGNDKPKMSFNVGTNGNKLSESQAKTISNLMSNSKTINSELKKQAIDNLYEPYRKYGFGNESKAEFAKKVKCEEIQIIDPKTNYDPDFPDPSDISKHDTVLWYNHPSYGDWMIEYNSSKKKTTYQEFYR